MISRWWSLLSEYVSKTKIGSIRLIGLGLLGVLLLIASSAFSNWSNPTPIVSQQSVEQIPQEKSQSNALEERLAQELSRIPGAGKVSVMITLESSTVKVFAENRNEQRRTISETDKQSGTRLTEEHSTQDTIVTGGSGGVVERELEPEIRGVLVMAEGANDITVRAELDEAVQTVLGIPAFRVSVLEQR